MNRVTWASFLGAILCFFVGCGLRQSSDNGVATATRSIGPTASPAVGPSQLPGCSQGARPEARDAAAVVYIPALHQAVLVGGRGQGQALADKGTGVSVCGPPVNPPMSPPTRVASAAAYDAASGLALIYD